MRKNTQHHPKISLSKTAAALALLLTAPFSATAQDNPQSNPMVFKHTMNPAVAKCLEQVTVNCALTAAVQTVSEEAQAMERSKVLVSVAESMIALGQSQRANTVLSMAEETARSTQLSIAIQIMLKELIPLHVRAGNLDQALSMVGELNSENMRDEGYSAIMTELAQQEVSYGGLKKINALISSERRAFMVLLKVVLEEGVILSAQELEDLYAQVMKTRAGTSRFRAIAAYAGLLWRSGAEEQAQVIFDQLNNDLLKYSSKVIRAQLAATKLSAMHYADMPDSALQSMLDYAGSVGLSINGEEDMQDFSNRVGPVEVGLDGVAKAVARSRYFPEPDQKIKYLQRLAKAHQKPDYIFKTAVESVLVSLKETEDRYMRDLMRYGLVRVAHSLNDQALMRQVILAMEDDDNQARGLALMAPGAAK